MENRVSQISVCCGNHALLFHSVYNANVEILYYTERGKGHGPIVISTVIRTKIQYVESKEKLYSIYNINESSLSIICSTHILPITAIKLIRLCVIHSLLVGTRINPTESYQDISVQSHSKLSQTLNISLIQHSISSVTFLQNVHILLSYT